MKKGTRPPLTGRFAPSPTGRMHLGNVFSALLSWLSARSRGGRWLLRIEDIDRQRSKQEYADLIMGDLDWLGLDWDGQAVYQSRREELYEAALRTLCGKRLVYPCFCTRADILAASAPHESDGRVVYRGACRRYLAEPAPDAPAALRMVVPRRAVTFVDGHYGDSTVDLAEQVGDFIVRRRDGGWAYQLAVVVDDADMGVTEVVRGRDLLLSSPQQIYTAEALGVPPPAFTHLPLLCNKAGQRLSKRDRALDLGALRQRHTAEEIIGTLAYLAGIAPDASPTTPEALLPLFDWRKVPLADIIVQQGSVPYLI